MEHKVVTAVANRKLERDVNCMFLTSIIIEKLSQKAKEMDLFYCRPCATLPAKESDSWFVSVAVGKNIVKYG